MDQDLTSRERGSKSGKLNELISGPGQTDSWILPRQTVQTSTDSLLVGTTMLTMSSAVTSRKPGSPRLAHDSEKTKKTP